MVRTFSTSEARSRLGDVLGSVYYTKQPVIIERKGRPVAVIISPLDYERYLQLQAESDQRLSGQVEDRDGDVASRDAANAFLNGVEAIRQRYAAELAQAEASVPRVTFKELGARLAGLEWPDEDFADDLEAVHEAMNRVPVEPLEWPS